MSFLKLVEFNWSSLSRTSLDLASLSILDIEIASVGSVISFDTQVSLLADIWHSQD